MVARAMPIDPLIGVDHARAVSRRVNWSVDKTKFGPHKGGLCKFILLLISEEWDRTSLFHFPLLGNYKIQVLGTHKYIKCTSTKSHSGRRGTEQDMPLHRVEEGADTKRAHSLLSLCVPHTNQLSLQVQTMIYFDMRGICRRKWLRKWKSGKSDSHMLSFDSLLLFNFWVIKLFPIQTYDHFLIQ